MSKVITIPYTPRKEQLLVHNSAARFKVVVAHRRLGKTILSVNEVIKQMLTAKGHNPRSIFVSPDQKQSRRNVWNEFKQYLDNVPGVIFNESELRISYPNGAETFLLGAENYHAIRGMALNYAVLDEVAQMPPNFFAEVVRPALSDREGGALFIGTVQPGSTLHDFYKLASNPQSKGWEAFMFRASETGIIKPSELEAMRQEMPEHVYMREMECNWDAVGDGSFYGESIVRLRLNGHMGEFEHDPYLPTIVALDLGVTDQTTIWYAQIRGERIHLIDFDSGHFPDLSQYVELIKSKGYMIDYLIAPHDVKQQNGVGVTRYDILKKANFNIKVAPRLGIQDGIAAVHKLLPRCYFNLPKVEKALESLTLYRSTTDKNTGKSTGIPLHDEHSDVADAFRYLAVMLKPAMFGETTNSPFFDPRKNRWINPLQERVDDYDPFKY